MELRSASRRAFTLIELLVAIGIIALLLAILLPAMERVRHKGYITACASNLRQLGQGLAMYANENHGAYPRTTADPAKPLTAGTGTTAADPFGTGGPQPNDVTAAIWLLLRVQKLPPALAICPYNDINEFEIDRSTPADRSNFTDFKKNLGYSYANPYADAAVTQAGYRLAGKLGAQFAVMADLNTGVSKARDADVFAPTPNASASLMQMGNSDNHEREGQNVLFGDGHVDYQATPLCGINADNIYTAQNAVSPAVFASPANKDDSVLLPTN